MHDKLIAHVAIFVCFQFDIWMNGCLVILVDFCNFWQVDVCQNYCKCRVCGFVTWIRGIILSVAIVYVVISHSAIWPTPTATRDVCFGPIYEFVSCAILA